jgi:predicted phosphodiesterase
MKVFAISDVHVDHEANARWVEALSTEEFQDDILVLAGDVSDDLRLLHQCLSVLSSRFRKVLFVPGNHDLWVLRCDPGLTSFDKFDLVCRVAAESGVSMARHDEEGLSVIPLLSWYDFSFGQPSRELKEVWADFIACRWPPNMDEPAITAAFLARNSHRVSAQEHRLIITFSHFMPREDLLPMDLRYRGLDLRPVLGTSRLDTQLRSLCADVHVYGHSHLNREIQIDGVTYVNNAIGYPREAAITSRKLRCVYEN